MTTAFGEPESKVVAEGILSTEVGQPMPAVLSVLRLSRRWLRDLRRIIASKVLELRRSAEVKLWKLKQIFTSSVAYVRSRALLERNFVHRRDPRQSRAASPAASRTPRARTARHHTQYLSVNLSHADTP